jgi:Cu+-exporting ATPase
MATATDPICGMAVDPLTADLTLVRENRTYYFCSSRCLREFAEPEREIARLRVRLAVAWPLSIAVVLLTYAFHPPLAPWIAFALASIVQFYPGAQFYRSTYDAARAREWNMDVLIAVGTTVAYVYSVAVLLLPSRLPPAYYFDASSFIVTLILTGNYLEHLTRERARGTLRRLAELVPRTVLLVQGEVERERPIAELRPGDRYRVRPGGRFPSDGRVVDGRSSVDESTVTGESRSVEKGPGDPVISGTVNGGGLLLVEATQVGEDTTLAEIARLVTEAETSRVPLRQLADRIASVFVPIVLVIAVATALGWLALGAGLTIGLLVFVSVAITACPCAFGIATPAAIVVGTGRAAEEGILFKGHDAIERASRIDLVLTDKTGTLTRGDPGLVAVRPVPGVSEGELLGWAASLERGSEHPLGRRVVEAAAQRGAPMTAALDLRALPGRGLAGRLGGQNFAILSEREAREQRVPLESVAPEMEALGATGGTVSIVTREGQAVGLLGFAEELLPGVPEAIEALRRDGIETVIATGDRPTAAAIVARAAGIREFHAGLTPPEKLRLLRDLQSTGRRVAFVGDGINDAPALAAADLGIAIGAGTEVAREAGGVVLLRSDFRAVALALRIGRRTVRKVRRNLEWALGYNAVLLPIAAGALVPLFGLSVYNVLPITGALAMGLSSTTVVLNSLSLRWISLR